jgi:hypothetical protein
MHKRFMKIILVGTLAVVVTSIVVGTASARVYNSGNSSVSLLCYPRGVVGAPGLDTATSTPTTQHVQKSLVTAGYSAFPEVTRTMTTTQHVQKSLVTTGYSAFPEVTRTMNLGNVTPATSSGFDWSNAGIGAGIGIGVASILALSSIAIRRSKATAAPA